MKITIYSENTPDGLEVDWPEVPRAGDWVRFHHQGGTDNLEVKSVDWNAETDGAFQSVSLHLSF